jgi:hypothetical protein
MERTESCEHGKFCFVFPCLIADFIEKLLNKSVQLGEFVHYKGDTCRKLGVSFFEYIMDIFSGRYAMPRLAYLISQNTSLKTTFY